MEGHTTANTNLASFVRLQHIILSNGRWLLSLRRLAKLSYLRWHLCKLSGSNALWATTPHLPLYNHTSSSILYVLVKVRLTPDCLITCLSPIRITWQHLILSACCNAHWLHSRPPLCALKTSWVNPSKSLTFETKSNFTAKCNKSSRAPGHVWLRGDLRIILIRLQHRTTA